MTVPCPDLPHTRAPRNRQHDGAMAAHKAGHHRKNADRDHRADQGRMYLAAIKRFLRPVGGVYREIAFEQIGQPMRKKNKVPVIPRLWV